MGIDLEAPNGDSRDWNVLYLARDDEVDELRPIFTGDVFENVSVQRPRGDLEKRNVMVVQHPCAMRPNGVDLAESILVADVRRYGALAPPKWTGSGKLMPLPKLLPGAGSGKGDHAAFYEDTYHVHPDDLQQRIACLSVRGVNLLMQRWVFHSSRVVVPTPRFSEVVLPLFEEADMAQEWVADAVAVGRSQAEATADFHAWLREDAGGTTRQDMLKSSDLVSTVRQQARKDAPTWRAPGT